MAVDQTTTSKEKILKKVRQALIYKSKPKYANIDLESNVYAHPNDTSILETFARNYTSVKGLFIICDNKFDFVDKLLTLQDRKKMKKLTCWDESLQTQLRDAGISFWNNNDPIEKTQVGITTCEALVARTGSILVSSVRNSRVLTVYPTTMLVVAYASQVVMEIKDAFQLVRNRYGKNMPSMLSFMTGPSRTGAVGQVQVTGAIGPKEVFVFLIDDSHSTH